jgi:hypothetical protein
MSDKISVRLGHELLDYIDTYARLMDIDRSKAIKQLLKAGTSNMANIELVKKFQDDLHKRWMGISEKSTKLINEGKNLILVRDSGICQKCHSRESLDVYPIDRNPLNTSPSNLITLCKSCISRVQKYAPQRRVYEDFVEWFFLL